MNPALRIAIASGKGGTGKTTVATNLAFVLAEAGSAVAYVDCDVEEPNGHLFLKPSVSDREDVSIAVPLVDDARCIRCGACARACHFSAIVALPNKVLTFPRLCHGCGGCGLCCIAEAISETPRALGVVERGSAGPIVFVQGRLNVAEAMAPPVIRAVLAAVPKTDIVIIDAPPGTSCPVIEAVESADVVLLVTEPTPFGLHDLRLAVEMTRELGKPFGILVNRTGIEYRDLVDYCALERIPILQTIPDDRELARAYSRGELAVVALPRLRQCFNTLYDQLAELRATACTRRKIAQRTELEPTQESTDHSAPITTIGRKEALPELVVISGKGGTGKTSLVASFFALRHHATVADCDVDAADLHLVLAPEVRWHAPFWGSKRAFIDPCRCSGCGICAVRCRFGAVVPSDGSSEATFAIEPSSCEGCGVCVDGCPERAVSLVSVVAGEWFVSDTRHGPMVHACLGVAQENSGKLVSLVRARAREVARNAHSQLVICDGSPGIGCPVVASITGASMALIVTEPTLSGLHDYRRVAQLCRHLQTRAGVCINKADLNADITRAITADAAQLGIPVLGHVRYDELVTSAQVSRLAVVEATNGPAAEDIRSLWRNVEAQCTGHAHITSPTSLSAR